MPSLHESDWAVLQAVAELTIENQATYVVPQELMERIKSPSVLDEDTKDAIDILTERGYLDSVKNYGGIVGRIKLTTFGYEQYAEQFDAEYPEKKRKLAEGIVAGHANRNDLVSVQPLSPSEMIFYLDILKSQGYIDFVSYMGSERNFAITRVSPELKRALKDEIL